MEEGDHDLKKSGELKLNGEQDAAVSFAVMGVLGLILHASVPGGPIFDLTDEVVWLALFAGA